MPNKTVIIGAGIAGLASAFRLSRGGADVLLLEQSSQVGGCIRSLNQDGYLLELGPNTFLNSSEHLWRLAEDAGLTDERIASDREAGKKRYLFTSNALHAVPSGPKILFSGVLSAGGRLRLLKEPFVRRAETNSNAPQYDESLARFICRRFGREVLDKLVTPFVSGVYAGNPETLSLKAIFPKLGRIEEKYGSVLRGIKELRGDIGSSGLSAFRAGGSTLTNAVNCALRDSVVRNARVTDIERLDGAFLVHYEQEGEQKKILARRVICAVPAYAAGRILSGLSDELFELLSGIEYAPVVVVHTGFKEKDVRRKLDGFGCLVPRAERVRLLGSLWSSALFPGRAPANCALLTNFIGGMLDKEAVDLTNDDIMRVVLQDLSRILGIKGAPCFACITRYPHAIAQYNIGHARRIKRINEIADKFDGLYLTGSYFTGISVSSTIEHAENTVKSVMRFF